MIISLSGRKSYGKTALSKFLIGEGYVKISFADKLKSLVSQLYGFDINDAYDTIKKESYIDGGLIWNDEKRKILELLACINLEPVREVKILKNIREALQFIGTEVLRKAESEYHTNSINDMLQPGRNYVLDDVRFPNELEKLKKLGAICIYIVRPDWFNVSNHSSETSLLCQDFEHILLNDNDEEYLLNCFKKFYYNLDNDGKFFKAGNGESSFGYDTLKNLMINNNFDTKKVSEILGCSRDKVVWWCKRYLINIPRNKYHYDKKCFIDTNYENCYYAGVISADGCIKNSGKSKKYYCVELASNDKSLIEGFKKIVGTDKPIYEAHHPDVGVNGSINYSLSVNCFYVVENMKLWDIKPRKSCHNMIPERIKSDDKKILAWFAGLIDGDGSVFYRGKKKSSVNISCLCSKQVAEYMSGVFERNNIKCCIYNEKNIDNLVSIRLHGVNAVKYYDIIRLLTLPLLVRKWSKIESLREV